MKKHGIVVEHSNGYFFAVNGELSNRWAPLDNSYGTSNVFDTFPNVQAYTKILLKTFKSVAIDKVIVTDKDLTDPNTIWVDDKYSVLEYDSKHGVIDTHTGEIVEVNNNVITKIMNDKVETLEAVETTPAKETVKQVVKPKVAKKASKPPKPKSKVTLPKKKETLKSANTSSKKQTLADIKKQARIKAENGLLIAKEQERLAQEKADKLEKANLKRQATIANKKAKAYEEEIDRLKLIAQHKQAKAEAVTEANNSKINNEMKKDSKTAKATAKEQVHTAEPVTETQKETNGKAPLTRARSIRRGAAKTAKVGVILVTDPIIQTGVFASDLVYLLMCETPALIQGAGVKATGLHPDATILELKEQALNRADARASVVYSVPKMAMNSPKVIKAYIADKKAKKAEAKAQAEALKQTVTA